MHKKIVDIKPVLCENYFKKLKEEDPDTLAFYINESNMSIGLLSIALPYLGETRNTKYLCTILGHINHESAIVREGAIIALWEYADTYKDVVLMEYKHMAEFDASETLRTMAEDFYLELVENYDIWFEKK